MKMRLAWYAGASTALAAGVVLSAFHQRANFYSAMVHLAQSSLSLMILVNLVFLIYGSFMYGLQRLCFGQLRPVEIEQLYEKAWFAVTETCLAMTIFREEVGAFFLIMFTALVTGKVWGWIGEGRVEVLEQQPPANPRLFHTRLSISLLLSVVYDVWLLTYAVNTVVEQARPTMMVMFLFEFAVLTVCSCQTGLRYIVSLVEQRVIRLQTQQRLEGRRRQVREQRAEILRRRETEDATEDANEELPNEDDVDEMDIEVPGWEAKGQWVLTLDLIADFVKLGIYTAFFCVLFTFYGLPIHIMRDWFMTTRSFLKRLSALLRYRQALKDMDQYPDATTEELGREDTCIICREEMRPWDPANVGQVERTRAKKLPCGHILHFGCLKSWLERQQVCPTCRRPVVIRPGGAPPARNGEAMVFRLGLNLPGIGQDQQPQQAAANGQAPGGGQAAPGGAGAQNNQQNQNNGVRMFNLGPLRLGFAQGGANDIQEMVQRLGMPADVAANPPAVTPTPNVPQQGNGNPNVSLDQIRAQLLDVGQRVQQEMQTLHNTAHELQMLNFVVNELGRLRQIQQQLPLQQPQQPQQPETQGQQPQQPQPQGQQHQATHQAAPAPNPGGQPAAGQAFLPHINHQLHPNPLAMFPPQLGQFPMLPHMQQFAQFAPRPAPTTFTRHVSTGNETAIPAGSPDLPEGLVLPPGWSLLPLQRADRAVPRADATPANPNTAARSTSSTGATQGSEQTDRTASSSRSAIERLQQPEATGSAAVPSSSSTAQVPPQTQQPATPHVTAPTPVLPNWGGSAQLFGGRSPEPIFGYQRGATPQPQDEESTAEGSEPPPATTNQTAAAESSSSSSNSNTPDEAEQDDSSTRDKGKARAATVEEADESDDDDD
ncbi:ERAD-associated E3 ubiquitin-protein ligase HRD1 [Diplogelasinospora grovesii]|uniref:RING-type E3 ubiquitin transferase n=1 Tax=Diplogelasinospora grovesii TaxID=303347 RepID=A0AAN6N6S1_9PEZI|nr:ERAD-associated E3 ubiquitin-protein ligase HRD1 [Diplogelasinospora grovesii]